jgi:ferritin-like metal-binding protein YciE
MATAKQPAKKAAPKKPAKQNPDMNELLLTELREIYSAEKQLSRALPRFSKALTTDTVREAFDRRLEQGQRLTEGLDRAFEELEASPGRKKNVAAEGLIADAQEHIQEIEKGQALDAVLIAAMQKLEHYCIAAWGTSKSIAAGLGEQAVVEAMQTALDEGKQLDEELTRLAEEELYPVMLGDDEEEFEGEERSFQASEGEGAGEEEQSSGGKSRKSKGGEARA